VVLMIEKIGEYTGHLDSIQGLTVYGWAYNKANPDERVEVVVLVDGKPVAEGVADQYREDLEKAGIGDGRHGFTIKIPDEYADGKEHKIEVQVKFRNNTKIKSLGSGNFILTPYIGYLDKIDGLVVYGWVYNSNNAEEKVIVYIYVDNKLVGTSIANLYREDLKNAGINDGNHGFFFKLPEYILDGAEHTISVKAYGEYELKGSPVKKNFIEGKFFSEELRVNILRSEYVEGTIIPYPVQYELRRAEGYSIYDTEDFLVKLLDDIKNICVDKEVELITCDVFDTILLRKSKCELRRFFEISEVVSKETNINSIDIFLTRLFLHKNTYTFFPRGKDGTIEGFFREQMKILKDMLSLSISVDRLIEIEILYESKNTIINPLFYKLLDFTNRNGLKLVLLSDMYLDSESIKKIFYKHLEKKVNFDIEIFSSADLLLSKRNGGIFEFLIEKYSINCNRILHIGDNLQSDYIIPKKLGLNAYYLPMPDAEKKRRLDDFKSLITELVDSYEIPIELLVEYVDFNF